MKTHPLNSPLSVFATLALLLAALYVGSVAVHQSSMSMGALSFSLFFFLCARFYFHALEAEKLTANAVQTSAKRS
jgi:hypothetical protein